MHHRAEAHLTTRSFPWIETRERPISLQTAGKIEADEESPLTTGFLLSTVTELKPSTKPFVNIAFGP